MMLPTDDIPTVAMARPFCATAMDCGPGHSCYLDTAHIGYEEPHACGQCAVGLLIDGPPYDAATATGMYDPEGS